MRGRVIFMALAVGSLMSCQRGPTRAGSLAELTEPIRILRSEVFLDGGTTSVTFVGAHGETLDAGFASGSDGFPSHCFVNAMHPTKEGARILPLWGAEERALVERTDRALQQTLTPDELHVMRNTPHLAELPPRLSEIYWLDLTTQERRKVLEALDSGELSADAPEQLGVRAPARLERILRKPDSLQCTMIDSIGAIFVATFRTTDRDSALAVYRAPEWIRKIRPGSWDERHLLTLLSKLSQVAVDPPRRSFKKEDLTDLQALIENRKRQILADDQRR